MIDVWYLNETNEHMVMDRNRSGLFPEDEGHHSLEFLYWAQDWGVWIRFVGFIHDWAGMRVGIEDYYQVWSTMKLLISAETTDSIHTLHIRTYITNKRNIPPTNYQLYNLTHYLLYSTLVIHPHQPQSNLGNLKSSLWLGISFIKNPRNDWAEYEGMNNKWLRHYCTALLTVLGHNPHTIQSNSWQTHQHSSYQNPHPKTLAYLRSIHDR